MDRRTAIQNLAFISLIPFLSPVVKAKEVIHSEDIAEHGLLIYKDFNLLGYSDNFKLTFHRKTEYGPASWEVNSSTVQNNIDFTLEQITELWGTRSSLLLKIKDHKSGLVYEGEAMIRNATYDIGWDTKSHKPSLELHMVGIGQIAYDRY